MTRFLRRAAAAAAAAAALAAGACNDFLTSGEAGGDPNRPVEATPLQRFAAIQVNISALLGSDPQRLALLFTQQLDATGAAYEALTSQYSLNESTTNTFNTVVYAGGGLIDVRRAQAQALSPTIADTTLYGFLQVQEALLIGTAADLFGDVVYTQAYDSTRAPALDPQLAVYDSVQAVLSRAITNIAKTGGRNVGPGASFDRVYGGSRARWIELAHTLKARFYLHTAEVRPGAYAQALAEARQGISDPDNNFAVPFTGNVNEQNLNYQFNVIARPGQIGPGTYFYNLLESRNDPRLATLFPDEETLGGEYENATAPQVLVSANENLLILAESAQRTGDEAAARAALRQAQQIAGVPQAPATLAGPDLLREILTEKYIALFPSIEPWNDYKRTCFPNLTPTATNGRKIPARLFYDANERQTNPNIPAPENQPVRNANDPRNATDPFGNACLGQ